jgi:hypothetical protein
METGVLTAAEPEVTDQKKFEFWLGQFIGLVGESEERLERYRRTANPREDKIADMEKQIFKMKQCSEAYALMLIDWRLSQEK